MSFRRTASDRFRVSFYHETTGALYGNGRAALHTADVPRAGRDFHRRRTCGLARCNRWMSSSNPDGLNLQTPPIAITAGAHQVAAAFIRRLEGPVKTSISPLDWSLASTSIADAYGFTTLPHLRDVAITGPLITTGGPPDREPSADTHVATPTPHLANRLRARNCFAACLTGVPSNRDGARCQRPDVAVSGRRC